MSTWAVSGYERAGLREMDSVKGSNLAIDETYLQGGSTRRVAKVMIGICGGNGDSATYIGQCSAQLDTLFEKWRNRPIPPIAHLFLNASCTKVRKHDIVSDRAVFVAVGIESETGRRLVLGVLLAFPKRLQIGCLHSKPLKMREMNRPNCITSDDYKGIRKAFAETLTPVPMP